MHNIIVIGTGNIGMRHLQSLSTINDAKLFAVEPNDEVRAKAQEIVENTEGNVCTSIVFKANLNEICELENKFDLAIIAVNSGARRVVVEELIKKASVENIIFEKVLFNKLSDYDPVDKLLKEKRINAWVNTVRRVYPYYIELKERLNFGGTPISFSLQGNKWGIGCNTIHYVDFLAFLSNTKEPFIFDTSGLDTQIIESKRKGYIEFTGTISAKSGDNTLSLTSSNGEFDGFHIVLEDERYRCEIEENGEIGTNKITDKQKETVITENFNIPFQSQLSAQVVKPIFESENCGLTSYSISAEYHKAMLCAFIDFVGKDNDVCNIT